jgi:hypothetical protein
MGHDDKKSGLFRLLEDSIQTLVLRRSLPYEVPEEEIGGLSYGQANDNFQSIMSAMREATAATDRLWNDVLDAIDCQTAIEHALISSLRCLAVSVLGMTELAKSRSQNLKGTGKSSSEELRNMIEEDIEAFTLIANKAGEALCSSHIRELDVELGDRYDPSVHEAASVHGSSYPKGSVCKVLEKGHIYRDECSTRFVVRPVRVGVSSGSEDRELVNSK